MEVQREVGVGLVGAGWMGRLHATAYARVRRHFPECLGTPRLVLVADVVGERAREVAEQFGFEGWTTDPLAVVRHPEVQAVSLTATNDAHRPVALAAAAGGRHLWGEKPLGREPAETAEIAGAAARAGIRTIVGFNYRQAPAVRHAHALIARGDLGDLRMYRGRFLVDYASDPRRVLSWRFLRGVAGMGVLGDLMSHAADMALHLAGPITTVSGRTRIDIAQRPRVPGGGQFSRAAEGELGAVENEDSAAAQVEFASGAWGTLEVSRTAVGAHCSMGFEVHGSRGALAWDFQRMNELRLHLPNAGGDVGWTTVFAGPRHGDFARFQPDAAVAMGYDDLKVCEARLFLDSVVDGVQRHPGADDALAVARVIAALTRSAARSSALEPVVDPWL